MDFNQLQFQTMMSNSNPSGVGLGGSLGYMGAGFANFSDRQGIWAVQMPNWMDAKIGGNRRPPGKIASIFQQMSEDLARINRDELAKLSQAGAGLIGPASNFSGAPTSGLATVGHSDIELG